jgi:hypothetical protein
MKPTQIKLIQAILLTGMVYFILCCSPQKITARYYYQNEKVLDSIEEMYKKLYLQQPFNIAFADRSFNTVSLQIITDTLDYIYLFEVNESRLADTLLKFHLDVPKTIELIMQMQAIRCAWVNNYGYYVDQKKNNMVFMSIKPVALSTPFSYKKYYILTYFPQPQYYDSTGHLLDKRKLSRLREINGDIFRRVNDKVCYTISGSFR